jgi:hypothetical protein
MRGYLPKFSSKLPGKESNPMVVDDKVHLSKGTIQRAKRSGQHQQQLANDLENKDDRCNQYNS